MHQDGAYPNPEFRTAGESGLIVEFGDKLSFGVNNAAIAFDQLVREAAISGLVETVPTIRSLLVRFDPLVIHPVEMQARLEQLLGTGDWFSAEPPANRTRWRVPAVYGGEYGPDLAEVAALRGVSEQASIESHSATPLRILMIGFAPGQAYLGIHDESWNLPRLAHITPKIAAGSIAVAIRQTVLFPDDSPTGWRVIGRSPFRSFRPGSERPFPFSPGDEVVFEPVPPADFEGLAERDRNGDLIAVPESIA